jgi:Flp pilus assembly pilin Flp
MASVAQRAEKNRAMDAIAPNFPSVFRASRAPDRIHGEDKLTLVNMFLSSLMALLPNRAGERGQTLVEYALIIALVSIMLVAALQLLTGGIQGVFDDIVAVF